MAERPVAADASPLIGLAAAGAFELLRELFGRVTVTEAVRDEVLAGGDLPGGSELTAAIGAGWIEVTRTPTDLERYPELGAGEASTLLLAIEHGGECLVLMDDSLGRARARALNLSVTGVAGCLLAAKRGGLIESVRPVLERLADRGFWISAVVARAVLEQAGED